MIISILSSDIQIKDIPVRDVIEITDLHQKFNEKRISLLISKVTELTLMQARKLTVSERYFILINHLSFTNPKYSQQMDFDSYVTNALPKSHNVDVPYELQDLNGLHAEMLEEKCENIMDYFAGAMAIQFHGDMSSLLNDDGESTYWHPIDITDEIAEQLLSQKDLDDYYWCGEKDKTTTEIELVFNERYQKLIALGQEDFNYMMDIFRQMCDEKSHLVDYAFDTLGVCIRKQGGTTDESVRFQCLSFTRGDLASIVQHIDVRRLHDDETRQHEHD